MKKLKNTIFGFAVLLFSVVNSPSILHAYNCLPGMTFQAGVQSREQNYCHTADSCRYGPINFPFDSSGFCWAADITPVAVSISTWDAEYIGHYRNPSITDMQSGKTWAFLWHDPQGHSFATWQTFLDSELYRNSDFYTSTTTAVSSMTFYTASGFIGGSPVSVQITATEDFHQAWSFLFGAFIMFIFIAGITTKLS